MLHADGKTDMTTPTVAFSNFVNVPKNVSSDFILNESIYGSHWESKFGQPTRSNPPCLMSATAYFHRILRTNVPSKWLQSLRNACWGETQTPVTDTQNSAVLYLQTLQLSDSLLATPVVPVVKVGHAWTNAQPTVPCSLHFFVLSHSFSKVTTPTPFLLVNFATDISWSMHSCPCHGPAGRELLHVNFTVKFQTEGPRISASAQSKSPGIKNSRETSITDLNQAISSSLYDVQLWKGCVEVAGCQHTNCICPATSGAPLFPVYFSLTVAPQMKKWGGLRIVRIATPNTQKQNIVWFRRITVASDRQERESAGSGMCRYATEEGSWAVGAFVGENKENASKTHPNATLYTINPIQTSPAPTGRRMTPWTTATLSANKNGWCVLCLFCELGWICVLILSGLLHERENSSVT
jgi:hypothetical protein